jgi:ParB-like chromosome segregation protein Spo0J
MSHDGYSITISLSIKSMKPKKPNPTDAPTASTIPVHCSHLRLADVVTLIANPRNPNKHSDKQVALLAKVIQHQGWRSPITISKRSGFVVTGHGRLAAALLLQVEVVPIDEQDFATEADEWAHLVADNRIAELADADRTMIAELLSELDAGGLDMDLTGFDMDALEELMKAPSQPDAPEDFPAVDENIETEPQCPKCGYQWSGGKMVEAEEEGASE